MKTNVAVFIVNRRGSHNFMEVDISDVILSIYFAVDDKSRASGPRVSEFGITEDLSDPESITRIENFVAEWAAKVMKC